MSYDRGMRRILLVSILLCACSSTHLVDDGGVPSGPYAGAYIGRDCAPDDGLAYRILLYEVAASDCGSDGVSRSLSFYFFEGSDRFFPLMSGSTVTSTTSSGGFGNGSATACPGGTPPCRTSQTFTLTFDTFDDMSRAAGSYSITWEDGETANGTFDASWCEGFGPPLCG